MSACCTPHASCQASMSAGSSAGSRAAPRVLRSERRAQEPAELVAAGEEAPRGGHSQHTQYVHIQIQRVQNFHTAPSRGRSRSRGRSSGTGSTMAPMEAFAEDLLPGARAKGMPRPFNVGGVEPQPRAALLARQGGHVPLTPPYRGPSPPTLRQALPLPLLPPPGTVLPWPERLVQIFGQVGVSADNYEPLEMKFDNGAVARSQGCPALRRPLPHEVEGETTLFVGFHATNEEGLQGILQTNGGQLKGGPASENKPYVFAKGFLAYTQGGADAEAYNRVHIERILNKMRGGGKHACGVIIEVSMWGIHKPCRIVAEEWEWAGKPHCFTRVHERKKGSRWTMPSEDAVVRALWVDFNWRWE